MRTDKKADSEYKNTHQKETYDVLKCLAPKGTKDLLKEHLGGRSVSSYLWELVQKDLEGK